MGQQPAPAQAVDYIEDTRSTYDSLGYPPYQWVRTTEPPSFVPLAKPLSECVVGLIASGGIYQTGQIAFHFKDDVSYRVIRTNADVSELRTTHFAYDLTDARTDINVVFPLETLQRAVADGVINAIAPEAYTFMGGIYSSRRVSDVLAPALAERMVAQNVDAVLLVPV